MFTKCLCPAYRMREVITARPSAFDAIPILFLVIDEKLTRKMDRCECVNTQLLALWISPTFWMNCWMNKSDINKIKFNYIMWKHRDCRLFLFDNNKMWLYQKIFLSNNIPPTELFVRERLLRDCHTQFPDLLRQYKKPLFTWIINTSTVSDNFIIQVYMYMRMLHFWY